MKNFSLSISLALAFLFTWNSEVLSEDNYPTVEKCLEKKRASPSNEWIIGKCYNVSLNLMLKNPSLESYDNHVNATFSEFMDFFFLGDILYSEYIKFSKWISLNDEILGNPEKKKKLMDLYVLLSTVTRKDLFFQLFQNLLSKKMSMEEKNQFLFMTFFFREFPNKDLLPFKVNHKEEVLENFKKFSKTNLPIAFEFRGPNIHFKKLKFSNGFPKVLAMVNLDCPFSLDILNAIANNPELRKWFSHNGYFIIPQNGLSNQEDFLKWNKKNPDLNLLFILKEKSFPIPIGWVFGVPQIIFLKNGKIIHSVEHKTTEEETIKALFEGIKKV